MELLAVIGVLAVLAIPVAVVALLIGQSKMRRRLQALEEGMALLRQRLDDADRALRHAAAPAPQPQRPAPAAERVAPEVEEIAATEVQSAEPAAPAEAVTGPWANLPTGQPVPPLPPQSAIPEHAPDLRRVSAFGEWIVRNWVYAVSALSLALAGIFLVQYGVENGLLPPELRVAAAIAFGLALIGGGEYVRRRWGDNEGASTAYLPSTFSGAGLVSMFGGVLAARQLYDLIGPEMAFAGFLATSALALVLGWINGPFLAAVGLVGAAAAPFVVGGQTETPYWLYGYFTLIAALGLGIDTLRRWAWVSVLALVLGYLGGWLVMQGEGGAGWWAFQLTGLLLLAIAIPARGLAPDHAGPSLSDVVRARGGIVAVAFPVRLAAAAALATTLGLALLPSAGAAESTVAFLCLALLGVTLAVWTDRAPGIADLAALPVAGFLYRIVAEALWYGPLMQDYAAGAAILREPETRGPQTAALLLGLAVALTLAAAWRGLMRRDMPVFWGLIAALAAPMTAAGLELMWEPARVIGAYPWALHVIALAALMAGLAIVFARADGEDRRRAAYMTLSTLSLIALALFLVTTKAALTVALAGLAVTAATLDRRFRLPEMTLFIQAAVVVLGYRLVVDPGVIWAIDVAGLWEVGLAYGGAAAAMLAGLRLLDGLDRKPARVFLESGLAAFTALLANVLITRWILGNGRSDEWLASHWAITLNAMPWLILMLVQLYRLQLGGVMRWVRIALAVVAGALAFTGLAAAAGPANPLFGLLSPAQNLVYGPYVFDTLLVAYGLPGVTLVAAILRPPHLRRWLRALLGLPGVALMALYAGLEIRRFWRGDDLSVWGVTQPELYSYTLALMLVGAALLYQAIARRSQGLRRIAMTVIALTIAKVFLIDISGLSGLTRVASFLALGLSLAALAWLNRWAAGRQEPD